MKIEQQYWTSRDGWKTVSANPDLRREGQTSLVLISGASILRKGRHEYHGV